MVKPCIIVTGVNHVPTEVKDLPTGGKKVYQQWVNHFAPEMNHTVQCTSNVGEYVLYTYRGESLS
jgi:hypothetical protein